MAEMVQINNVDAAIVKNLGAIQSSVTLLELVLYPEQTDSDYRFLVLEFSKAVKRVIEEYDSIGYWLTVYSTLREYQQGRLKVYASLVQKGLRLERRRMPWRARPWLFLASIVEGRNIWKEYFDALKRISELTTCVIHEDVLMGRTPPPHGFRWQQ